MAHLAERRPARLFGETGADLRLVAMQKESNAAPLKALGGLGDAGNDDGWAVIATHAVDGNNRRLCH